MVTWGQNQVFQIGSGTAPTTTPATPASSSTLFGKPASTPLFTSSPAPATSGSLFGGTPSMTPAPSGGFFSASSPAPSGSPFGAQTTAPAPGSGLFGSALAPSSGGLFGSTPAPASSGGLFGSAPAPSSGGLFGFGSNSTSGSGLFGSAPAPPSSLFSSAPGPGSFFSSSTSSTGPTLPAQAAIQAHLDASARQAAAEVQQQLDQLHHGYAGTSTSSPFVNIVYNHLTSQEMTFLIAQQAAGGPSILIPPKPAQVADSTWYKAAANNPDPSRYIPVALVGAEALQARVAWQQTEATQAADSCRQLQHALSSVRSFSAAIGSELESLHHRHAAAKTRLLKVMTKVHVLKSLNMPLQPAELEWMQRLDQVLKSLQKDATEIKSEALPEDLNIPAGLHDVLQQHRQSLLSLTHTVQKDQWDVSLLQQRLETNANK